MEVDDEQRLQAFIELMHRETLTIDLPQRGIEKFVVKSIT